MRVVLRTCIACRNKQDQRNMNRIVKKVDGDVVIDQFHKIDGRGAYVCKNSDCVAKVRKNKTLNRHLKVDVDDTIYNALKVDK